LIGLRISLSLLVMSFRTGEAGEEPVFLFLHRDSSSASLPSAIPPTAFNFGLRFG
jgi:hypothetical protein